MVKDAEANAEKDKEQRELVDIKNQAEQIIYSAETQINELSDKLPVDTKTQIQEAINSIKDKLINGNKEDIQNAINNLQNMLASIIQPVN